MAREVGKKFHTGVWRVLWMALALAVSLALAACGSSNQTNAKQSNSNSGKEGSKLIIADIGFPCGLNDFAHALCNGFSAVQKELPSGYTLQLKNGINFEDTSAFNDMIQTGVQLHPAGIIVFPNGPAGQVPVLKQACAQGVKVFIIDNPVNGLGACQSGFIAANDYQLGVDDGRWLIAHPPASKEVGIVTFPPGETSSIDDRVKGFSKTIEAAGFKVVSTVTTSLSLDQTRTGVTNMLTAHPNLGAVFSANDQMGDGAWQAVNHSHAKVLLLSLDGSLEAVKRIPAGEAVDGAQDPYFAARQSVLNMVKLIEGHSIKPVEYEPSQVVDASNAKAYLAAGGLR